MTSEEIHLNPALEKAGIEVTETDFGEYIMQVAGERPSHLVAPAVHHTRESVARVLSEHLGETLPDDPQSAGPDRAARACARSSIEPTWALPAPTSPSPKPARSSWSPTKAMAG